MQKVAVFDTYVQQPSKATMHFDIVVPEGTDASQVHEYGLDYLNEKGVEKSHFSTNLCNFCHIEHPTPEMLKAIGEKGYYIIEMEGCHP